MSTFAPQTPSCPGEEDVLAYLTGEGNSASSDRVREHLCVCNECRAFVGALVREHSASTSHLADLPGAGTTFSQGDKIAGRYEVRRFIARGGMGEVYEAFDPLLGETVAVKTLRSRDLESARALARLRQEVSLARKVTHPNVCRIIDIGSHPAVDGAVPFLTMELLSGETLAQRIERQPLSWDEARDVFRQLVAGLSAIHSAGVVHRDIKTENVFLANTSDKAQSAKTRVVILDLGLARHQDPDSRKQALSAGFVVGTLDYMAPEQLEGATPNPAFDIYALGVMMFEVVTGRRPFVGSSPIAAALERAGQPAPLASRLRADVPRSWSETIDKCLSRDPARRPSSAEEVWRHLSDAGDRRSRLSSAVGAAFVVVLIVGAAAWRVRARTRDAAKANTQSPVVATIETPVYKTEAAPTAPAVVAPSNPPTETPTSAEKPVRARRRPLKARPLVTTPSATSAAPPATIAAPAAKVAAPPLPSPAPSHVPSLRSDDLLELFPKK